MNTAATAPPLAQADASGEPTISVLHSAYFEQIIPSPPIICGRQLKALSIGRYRLLSLFKVAFVSEIEAQASAGDLLIGVLICSMACEEFKAFAASKNFKEQVQVWGRRFGFFPPKYLSWRFFGKWLSKKAGNVIAASDAAYLVRQMQLFQQYIQAGSQAPSYFDESDGGRVSGAHWSHSVEVTLRGKVGWSQLEIEEEPLSKALNDFFKHMENEGMVRLMTDGERRATEAQMTPEKNAEWEAYFEAVEKAKLKEASNG